MSLPHCVSSAALDIEHGREGGHFALQKRPHNLVAPNAVAHIATSQKGLACTPRDPKCGRFFFVFLDFGQISPPAIFGQPWPATGGEGGRGGGGGVQPAQPRLGTPLKSGLWRPGNSDLRVRVMYPRRACYCFRFLPPCPSLVVSTLTPSGWAFRSRTHVQSQCNNRKSCATGSKIRSMLSCHSLLH